MNSRSAIEIDDVTKGRASSAPNPNGRAATLKTSKLSSRAHAARRPVARERVWLAGRALAQRAGWPLDGASVERRWTVDVGGTRVEVHAFFSFFFHEVSERAPATVFAINFPDRQPGDDAAIDACVADVHARLGERYRNDRERNLVFVLRRTSRPREILDEIDRIGRILGDARAAFRNRRFSARSLDGRLWEILGALRAARRWQLSGLDFTRPHSDGEAHVRASIILYARDHGPAQFSGHFSASAPSSWTRWPAFSREVDRTLTATGYRATPTGRARELDWSQLVSTLRPATVLKEAALLDRLLAHARSPAA